MIFTISQKAIKMKTFLFYISFFFSCFACFAQRDTAGIKFRQRDDMAKNKLAGFSASLNEANMKNFGFTSIDDLKNATLSAPFELATIPLDQLRNYTGTTNINSLINHTSKFIYPIINTRNQQVINAMMVDKTGSQWSLVSMGRGKPLAATAFAQAKRLPNNNYFVATIPSLNLDFIAYYSNNVLLMIPVVSDPQNKLEAGRPEPANKILTIYSAAAKKYNGLPM